MAQKKPEKNISLGKKLLRYLFSFVIIMFLTCFCGLIVGGMLIAYWLQDVPELDTSLFYKVSQTSFIYDKNGEVLTSYNAIENRDWVDIEDVPEQLQQAFVAVEDRRFYSHPGFDVKRLGGAILTTLFTDGAYGGSTITQQLIKNTILNDDPTIKRKVQEIYLAIQLEKQMSKDEILEAYINIIYLGDSNYGVKTAALNYLGKDLGELSLKECALIAGITQNPYGYQPIENMYYNNNFEEKNGKRINVVLKAMVECGYITQEEKDAAMEESIYIVPYSNANNMYKYPHFVEYVISDVIDGFITYRGMENTSESRHEIENEIRNGGYKIYATIDPQAQEILENSVKNYNNYPSFIESTKEIPYEIDPIQPQVAAVIMDQHNGNIIAMVGNRNTPTAKKTFNRATDSIMSVGSTIKPLSIYAPALDLGFSPASIEYDFADNIRGYDISNSFPKNSKTTNKPITLRESLIYSYNIPTARLLCYGVGFERASAYLTRLGVNSKSISETGFGMALGGSGINMLSLTGAYAALANEGVYLEPRSYSIVTDSAGNVILNAEDVKAKRVVFSKEASYLTTDILKQVITSGTGVHAQIEGITTAGKTGTNEQNSITFAGYTGYYTSALWIGHDASIDFKDDIESGDYAAPLWQEYMSKIHKGLPDKEIIDGSDLSLSAVTVCSVSGKLPTELCGDNVITDIFTPNNVPTEPCDLHRQIKVCSITNQLASDYCPSTKLLNCIYVASDSELNSISHDLVKQYLGVIYEDDVNLGESGCSVHTSDYSVISNTKINNAKSLKSQMETLLKSDDLTDTQREYIGIHISNLDYLLSNANRIIDPASSQKFASDFNKFYQNALDYYTLLTSDD